MERVDCDTAHQYELFATLPPLGGSQYPGRKAAKSDADDKCSEEFIAFLDAYSGPETLRASHLAPDEEEWYADESVQCYLKDIDGSSLYGSALDDAPNYQRHEYP
ncbi:hypothetical protein [Streptomyces sp. NPDC053542]|uniref:hypothetical protein n=1 Tax=Streptomyces sp. NPDC053542 TaxID=3365710 RepID=UPI0037D3620E